MLKVDGLCYLLQEIYGIENKLNQKSGKVCTTNIICFAISTLQVRFFLYWPIGNCQVSKSFLNQVASAKILVAMVPKLVATGRVACPKMCSSKELTWL